MGNSTQKSESDGVPPSPERLGSQIDLQKTQDRLKFILVKRWLKIAKANCSTSFTTELNDLVAWCDLKIKECDCANTEGQTRGGSRVV